MHTLTSFATSLPGLLIALAAALGAALGLMRLFHRSGTNNHNGIQIVATIFCTACCALSLCILLTVAAEPDGLKDSREREWLLGKAFAALNEHRHSDAISLANTIILSCGSTALNEERALELGRHPLPPTGHASDAQRPLIFAHGVLNDTAAAHWIKAAALEQLGHPHEAAQSYRALAPLNYARVFDPAHDLFWSPAQEAQHALTRLELASTQ